MDLDGALSDRRTAALNRALLEIAGARSSETVLQRLLETARTLVDARYAALGIPDGHGGFSQFLTVGIDDEQMARIGPLPRVHGMLGAMLDDPEPFRTPDITADPRFGSWPPAHPDMRSFLGVPVSADGAVIAAFYLTDKEGAEEFDADDERLIGVLAAHAAVAIENARLWEQAQEDTTQLERARVARELHDAMSQTLFSLQLTAATAAGAVEDDPAAARTHLTTVQELARTVQAELRSVIVDLAPPDLASDGLAETLRKHVRLLDRVHDVTMSIHVEDAGGGADLDERTELALLRVGQEALHNALRHASASEIEVALTIAEDEVALEVRDDGVGFDPGAEVHRSTHLGLVSMRHRARAAGGRLSVDTAPGKGTVLRLRVPRG